MPSGKYRVWILFLAFFTLPLLLIVSYAVLYELFTGVPFSGDDFFISLAFAIIIPVSHTAIFLLLLFFLKRQNLSIADIGLVKANATFIAREILAGVLLGFLVYSFKEVVLDSLTAILAGQSPTFHSFFNFQFKKAELGFMLVSFIFPFVEECVFRGYPLQQWKSRYPPWKICLITSVAFGLMHLFGGGRDFTSAVSAAILGAIYFGIFYWRQNLYSSSSAHSFYNLLIVLT